MFLAKKGKAHKHNNSYIYEQNVQKNFNHCSCLPTNERLIIVNTLLQIVDNGLWDETITR